MTLLRPALTDDLIAVVACLAATAILGIEGIVTSLIFGTGQLIRGAQRLAEPGVRWKERGNGKL